MCKTLTHIKDVEEFFAGGCLESPNREIGLGIPVILQKLLQPLDHLKLIACIDNRTRRVQSTLGNFSVYVN